MEEAAAEKLYAAEKLLAAIRLAIVIFNSAVYLFLMQRVSIIPWLAYTIIAGAFLYSLVVVLCEPYRRYSILLSSYFTSGLDAVFITLWILATGGIHSPFYVLWYASLTAIAFRYNCRATLLAAGLYAASDLLLFPFLGELSGHLTEATVRTGYIFALAILGGSLANETYRQTQGKVKLQHIVRRLDEEMAERQRVEEARRASETSFRLLFATLEAVA